MPGHKGRTILGPETLDITEIDGADSLYEADGIIRESEENASALFGMKTLYSTEGSSLCIRAMLYLACLHAGSRGKRPMIAAGRNAHKTFLSAAALMDFEVMWLCPRRQDSYLACRIQADELDEMLRSAPEKPDAVYLTSPDYLGNVLDIRAIAEVCHRQDVLLIVDNAHGAYLKFLPDSLHPVDLGADACCDSAHKTLPVLTGGAYLHIADDAPQLFREQAKNALALFASTSPSYLILQSLDSVNAYLTDGYREKLADFVKQTETCKANISAMGYTLTEQESLKITIDAKAYGYSGKELEAELRKRGIVSEFADPDFLVLMLTPDIGVESLNLLQDALGSIPKRTPLSTQTPAFHMPQKAMTIRQAVMSPSTKIPAQESLGRVLAIANVGCPPAVPIVVSGEKVDQAALECFRYYGIRECWVVK